MLSLKFSFSHEGLIRKISYQLSFVQNQSSFQFNIPENQSYLYLAHVAKISISCRILSHCTSNSKFATTSKFQGNPILSYPFSEENI